MACLKCGKKTTDEQSFCTACLKVMDTYPVRPDVHVQLPNRSGMAAAKKSGRKKRALPAEEQVPVLRRRIRRLAALVLVLALLLGAAVTFLVKEHFAKEDEELGKNYTYDESLE